MEREALQQQLTAWTGRAAFLDQAPTFLQRPYLAFEAHVCDQQQHPRWVPLAAAH